MFEKTAILLLASGLSSRFEAGDKLMAPLRARTVLQHSASALAPVPVAARIAVVGEGQDDRRRAVEALGYEVVINPDPASGQGHSLALGAGHVRNNTVAESILILLADMPNVSEAHLNDLGLALEGGAAAVMTRNGDTLCPPALFGRDLFDALASLEGDMGARGVFLGCSNRRTVEATDTEILDVDSAADLLRAEAL